MEIFYNIQNWNLTRWFVKPVIKLLELKMEAIKHTRLYTKYDFILNIILIVTLVTLLIIIFTSNGQSVKPIHNLGVMIPIIVGEIFIILNIIFNYKRIGKKEIYYECKNNC